MESESRTTQTTGVHRGKRTQTTLYLRKEEEKDETNSSLAVALRYYLKQSGRSIYQLSNMSGVDSAYIWRILRGERQNVSREVLLLLSLAIAIESDQAGKVIEVANDLFEAAGFKGLR